MTAVMRASGAVMQAPTAQAAVSNTGQRGKWQDSFWRLAVVWTNVGRDFLASGVLEFLSAMLLSPFRPSNQPDFPAVDFYETPEAHPLPVVSRLPDLSAPIKRYFHLGSCPDANTYQRRRRTR